MAEIAASLPSWDDGPAKAAIVEFVARVTKSGGPGFVPAPERIATFDNDGTVWWRPYFPRRRADSWNSYLVSCHRRAPISRIAKSIRLIRRGWSACGVCSAVSRGQREIGHHGRAKKGDLI